MKKQDKKLVYEGPSLETFLTIKNRLNESHIQYEDYTKQAQGLFQLISLLLVIGRPSVGVNHDRNYTYQIFVNPEDYDKAIRIAFGRP